MTPERAKSATPALPRSLPKPFPEAPHHQPTTKCLQKQARKGPQTKPETRSHSPINSLQTAVKGIHNFAESKDAAVRGALLPHTNNFPKT